MGSNPIPSAIFTTSGRRLVFYVYVVRSLKDGRLYTGVTGDLSRRLAEHNRGKTRSLRARRPVRLVYSEEFATKAEALARERYFKTPEGGTVKKRLVTQADGPG